MSDLFLRVLAAAAAVSALLFVLLVPARRWLEGRYAPQTRLNLWLGIAVLLLLSLGWFSLGAALPSAVVVEVPDVSVELPARPKAQAAPVVGRPAAVPSAPVVSAQPGNVAAEPAVQRPVWNETAPVPARKSVSVLWVLGTVWLGVAGLLLAGQAGRYLWGRRRLMRESRPTEAGLFLETGVRVRILPGLEGPMAVGCVRPVVFLPEGEVAPMAVRHEMAHIRRGDLWGKGVLFLACALYWFDPLVWQMARVAGLDMEAACDARVVRGLSAAEKRSYGELLLSAAAGGRSLPLATRFGGSGAQMKARLTQLFRPGKTGKALVCLVLAAALGCTCLVACERVSRAPAVAYPSEGVCYATLDWGKQKKEGLETVTFDLVDFSPAADWVGGVYATVPLEMAQDVRLDGEVIGEAQGEALLDFLTWPRRPAWETAALETTVLRLEMAEGKVAAMDWYAGAEQVGGVLWSDSEYGDGFPCVLRLPESWRDKFTTQALERGDALFRIGFYQKDSGLADGLFFVLTGEEETGFDGLTDAEIEAASPTPRKVLGRGDGVVYSAMYVSDAHFDAGERAEEYQAMMADAQAQLGPDAFAWVGPRTYVNEAWGFSLTLPESWQGRWTAEEAETEVFFGIGVTQPSVTFTDTDTGMVLLDLIVRSAPLSEEELTGRVKLIFQGSRGCLYAAMPQRAPVGLFEDLCQAERYRLICKDILRCFEEGDWQVSWQVSLGPAQVGGPEELVPLADLEREFGVSDYYSGFRFDEVSRDGQDWYRLRQEGGAYTLYVDGSETHLWVEMEDTAGGRNTTREVHLYDLPWFLPSHLGSEWTSLQVCDVTGDGVEDLIVRVAGGGTGAHAEYCRVADLMQGQVYALSDLGGGAFVEEMLSWVTVENRGIVEERDGYGQSSRYAQCAVSVTGQGVLGGKCPVGDGVTDGTCDETVSAGAGYFSVEAREDGLWADVSFTVASGLHGFYIGSVEAPLLYDGGGFWPDWVRCVLTLNEPVELPDVFPRETAVTVEGGKTLRLVSSCRQENEYLYGVSEIRVMEGEKTLQTLAVRTAMEAASLAEPWDDWTHTPQTWYEPQVMDLNFDGNPDIRLVENMGTVNFSWLCWLWNPANQRFEYGFNLVGYEMAVDAESREITVTARESASSYEVSRYAYDQAGQLQLEEKEVNQLG